MYQNSIFPLTNRSLFGGISQAVKRADPLSIRPQHSVRALHKIQANNPELSAILCGERSTLVRTEEEESFCHSFGE
jgi:hypothetical protein